MRLEGIAVAALLAVGSSGCAAGWVAVRPELGRDVRPAPDWSGLRFTVAGPPVQRWALVRVLRARYGVLELGTGPRAPDAFHVEVVPGKTTTRNTALAALSVFTFAAVPGVWSDATPVRHVLACPGGAVAEASGELTETTVSWAPFALLGPTLFVGMNGGIEDFALERDAAAEALAAAALASFEPVVAAHVASGAREDGR
jgi:hypothetical protein